jgi:hypothetical protein
MAKKEKAAEGSRLLHGMGKIELFAKKAMDWRQHGRY